MPKRDKLHELVRKLLEQAGWRITHDPLTLPYSLTNTFVDLGAEAPMGAELDGRKIAVEVKSFAGLSGLTELERAIGQFIIYKALLQFWKEERTLYLAIPSQFYGSLLDLEEGRAVMAACDLKLILYNTSTEVIEQWIE